VNVQVVAAVLRDGAGRVLIAQRPPGKHMAGYWEFPGGKVMPGESPESALARELKEELGVQLLACQPLLRLQHEYPDRVVDLAVFTAADYRGVPAGLEGQALKWVPVRALAREPLLPADQPIVEAIAAEAAAGASDAAVA
jgi:8-oxo-dGTP diphosphatase